MDRMTLDDWAKLQPYAVGTFHTGARWIPDSGLVGRWLAFRLSDYVVSSIGGGTIWFIPRESEPCRRCSGTGNVPKGYGKRITCPACGGEGVRS